MRQEKGGECDNGHKDESQALYRIWEGFKTICVLDILGVCVCVCSCLPCWVFCTIQKCWYPCISSSHQTGFLSTSMYALNHMVGPRKSKVSQGDPLFEERIDEQNHDEDTHADVLS